MRSGNGREPEDGMPSCLIAPTEPAALKRLGKVVQTPEMFGVDVMWIGAGGLVGVQRKTTSDLFASIDDGRLAKEVAQMKRVHLPVLLIEGRVRWTAEGELVDVYRAVNRSALRGLLHTIRSKGIWVDWTDDLDDTVGYVEGLYRWSRKERHTSLVGRPNPKGPWGTVEDEAWSIHLLTAFEGIGAGVAAEILEFFGGVPLRWDCDAKELQKVPGIGPVRAKRLIRALGANRP